MGFHEPVFLTQCIEALKIKPDGAYVDATFGGGGHSKEILKNLKSGKLFAFDRDSDAKANIKEEKKLTFIDKDFKHLKRYLKLYKQEKVDGIMADLGVSSYQLDTPERGFSYRFDSQVDMRMDKGSGVSAFNIINEYNQEELQRIFSGYGEIRNSKTLAIEIVKARKINPIITTADLKNVVSVFTRGNPVKYISKVFQAIRIEVNDELGSLQQFLEQSIEVLNTGGRLVIISYHSLEDRIAKNFIKAGNALGEVEKDFYGNFLSHRNH